MKSCKLFDTASITAIKRCGKHQMQQDALVSSRPFTPIRVADASSREERGRCVIWISDIQAQEAPLRLPFSSTGSAG
jgi:hypothetical protein